MQRMSMERMQHNSRLGKMLKGAIAGAIGVWAMDRLDWFMFNHEDPAARRRTETVRPGGLDPAHVAVNRMAHSMGTRLSPSQPHPAGLAMHYALGIGPAALYAAFRDRLPVQKQGQDHLYGIGLGLGLFLLQDEVLNRVMGLSAKPRDYPWQAHARGFAAHLLLGLATNAALNLLKTPRPSPRRFTNDTSSRSSMPRYAAPPTRNTGEARPSLH